MSLNKADDELHLYTVAFAKDDEAAFAKCSGLTAAAEHTVRQATLAVLVKSHRLSKKLRTALRRPRGSFHRPVASACHVGWC